jgi:hypothetical protein
MRCSVIAFGARVLGREACAWSRALTIRRSGHGLLFGFGTVQNAQSSGKRLYTLSQSRGTVTLKDSLEQCSTRFSRLNISSSPQGPGADLVRCSSSGGPGQHRAPSSGVTRSTWPQRPGRPGFRRRSACRQSVLVRLCTNGRGLTDPVGQRVYSTPTGAESPPRGYRSPTVVSATRAWRSCSGRGGDVPHQTRGK